MMQRLLKKYFSNKNNILITFILVISFFVNLHKLSSLMQFYGDVGWFYISARDMLLTGHIPLVGITSSHTWLHQGAIWTYILAIILKFTNFNVVAGAYFIAIMGTLTVYLVYRFASEMFSQRIGLISAFIYSTSFLIIQNSRLSYHTSLIPFFVTLLLYSIYKWIKGNPKYFPAIALFLAILYNFELATFSISAIFILIFIFGLFTKKIWVKSIFTKQIVGLSILAFLVPMLPMILYDIHHGYPQTVKFVIWIFYKIALIFGYPSIHQNTVGETWKTFFPYLFGATKEFVFAESESVSLLIVFSSFFYLLLRNVKEIRSKHFNVSNILIFLFFLIPTIAYISEKTNSASYLFMFFPQAVIMLAIFVDFLMKRKYLFFPTLIALLVIGFSNTYILIQNNYFSVNNYQDEQKVAKTIVRDVNGQNYNLVGRGNGSQYESFLTPYIYLTWQLGHPPVTKNEKLKFYITQDPDRIKLQIKR